ncbi:hypothetical protein TSUD_278490 [Trifolium subterraneum]|uniref:U1-type domain-containing protein n=1 Tax=Trifolium subterraneum TaxID=3900 RepID=A0A2Z6M1P6_TRISU|nr:hypothetical protein TSUD_278490 [Trifolium subterraneum]
MFNVNELWIKIKDIDLDNGNFQNNYSGGWNDVPFNGFSQEQFDYNYQQMPTQYNDNNYLPHQTAMQYADNMKLPHQTPAHYVDNKQLPPPMPTQYIDNRQLPPPMPTQYVDNRQMPHQTPMQNVDNRQLPHQMPIQNFDNSQLLHQTPMQTQYVDNMQLPHQTAMLNIDNKQLPHQMPMPNFDNSQLLHQMPSQMQTQYVDNRQLQHHMPMQNVDNRQLPHQMVIQNFDDSHLLHRTPMQTQYVDNRQLPHQMPDNKQLPHHMPMQNFDNRQLLNQTQEQMQYVDNRQLSPQTLMQNVDNRQLSHQMPMQTFDNNQLLHQTQMQHVDNRQLPHETPMLNVDNKQLPHQMQNFDNSQLLHQMQHQTPMQNVDNKQLPHQMAMQNFDNSHLPHHMPMQNFDNRQLLNQMPAQMQYVENRQLSPQTPMQNVDNRQLPHHIPMQNFDNRQLLHQTPAQMQYVDNRQLSPHMPAQYVDNSQLPHPTPTLSVDKSQLPHQAPTQTQYVDNSQLAHQMPTQYVDNRKLPHQTPPQYVDNRQILHQTQLVDNRQLPHQMLAQHVDNRALPPNQMPEQHVDNRQVPHQVSVQLVDNRQLPHQMPVQHVNNRTLPSHQMPEKHLPHQMPAQHVDNRQLLHQMPAHFAVNGDLPQQTPEDRADKKCLPSFIHCDICNITMIPECLKEHDNGKKHQRLLLELRQMQEGYADKKCLPQQMPKVTADKRPLPHEKPDYDDELCLTPLPPLARCEICNITMIPKSLEQHYNGKRHKKVLLELRKQSAKHKTSNGEESRHIRDSQVNPVVPPKKVPKFKKVWRPVENMNHEAQGSHWYKDAKRKHMNHIHAMGFKNKKSKRKVRDNTNAKNGGFKRKIGGPTGSKYMKMNNGKRRRVKSSNPEVNALSNSVESLVQLPELTPSSGCVASPKTAPIPAQESSFELQSQHVSAPLSQESKGKEYHKFQNTVEKIDQPQSTPVELNASTGYKTEFLSSDFAAIAPPQVPATSQVFTPPAAVESSFEPKNHIDSQREVTEAKEHHEIQNHALERNDQPDSISMEFHAPTGSDINTLIEDSCSDYGAIVIATPQSPIASHVSTPVAVIDSELSESKVHNEIQNHIVDSNDQQHLVSMELQDPAGSITNNQTEVLNSDSTAIEVVIEPLASAPPDASLSCFEALTEHGLPTEIEPEVSESVAYFDSQHPTEETNIELLPSVSMEIDALSEVSAETETEDGNSQVEVEMDVVATESEISKLPQVTVCLTCGDEGFEEAIVYCNKCEDCFMHRYCLDGPVIFTDEVIWFCEDCEQEVVDADYPDDDATDSEKCDIDSIADCVTVIDPQPIADPIWRGSLQVFHKSNDKIPSLVGHLSTLACPKVQEETKHLPYVLNADLLPRSAVWPTSFAKFGTNNQSIGLYFFPPNER